MDRQGLIQELAHLERGLERVFEYIVIQEQFIDMIEKQFIDDIGSDKKLLIKAQLLLAKLQEVRTVDMKRRDRILQELDQQLLGAESHLR